MTNPDASRKGWIRYTQTLLAKGETAKAEAYARSRGLAPHEYLVVVAEPAPSSSSGPTSTVTPTAALSSGWPLTASAEVTRQPPNKALLGIRLADGRDAVMWKMHKNPAVRSHVMVRLQEVIGGTDPYYVPVFADERL